MGESYESVATGSVDVCDGRVGSSWGICLTGFVVLRFFAVALEPRFLGAMVGVVVMTTVDSRKAGQERKNVKVTCN